MAFRLSPIFVKSKILKSDEVTLNSLGLSNFKKGKIVDFYDTNKQGHKLFIGTKENFKILCNGELANKAFEDESLFLSLKDTVTTSIIWNETSDEFGFCLIKDGKMIRKVLVSDGEFKYDFGNPISEELEIKDDEIFDREEKEEIIDDEGEEVFKEMVKAEKVYRVASILVKRYLGAGIEEIQERI